MSEFLKPLSLYFLLLLEHFLPLGVQGPGQARDLLLEGAESPRLQAVALVQRVLQFFRVILRTKMRVRIMKKKE